MPASYLLGAIPQVYLLGRAVHRDLRKEGDLHQALWRASRPLGVIAILSDMAKGLIVVLGLKLLGAELWLVGFSGVGVVMGQMWPVFMPSTGGKGNSTALPVAAALSPGALLFALVPVIIGLVIRTSDRILVHHTIIAGPQSYVFPLAALTGFVVLPVAAYVMREPEEVTLTFLALLAAILFRRLSAGLRADVQQAPNKGKVVLNRLLFDRGFTESPGSDDR